MYTCQGIFLNDHYVPPCSLNSSHIDLILQQHQRKDDDAQRALFKAFHVLKHLCDFEGVAKERLREK